METLSFSRGAVAPFFPVIRRAGVNLDGFLDHIRCTFCAFKIDALQPFPTHSRQITSLHVLKGHLIVAIMASPRDGSRRFNAIRTCSLISDFSHGFPLSTFTNLDSSVTMVWHGQSLKSCGCLWCAVWLHAMKITEVTRWFTQLQVNYERLFDQSWSHALWHYFWYWKQRRERNGFFFPVKTLGLGCIDPSEASLTMSFSWRKIAKSFSWLLWRPLRQSVKSCVID